MNKKDHLLVGNEISSGIWEATVTASQMSPETVEVRICTHERQNDSYDACLDCGAIRDGDKWQ